MRIFMIIAFTYFLTMLLAQVELNGPEGMDYDSANDRYLVANYYSGEVIQFDENLNMSVAFTGLEGALGLHIQDNLLYVTSNSPSQITCFSLENDELLYQLEIENVNYLAHMCHDNSGNIYISEQSGKIVRFDSVFLTHEILISQASLEGIQGLVYDESTNSIIFCKYSNSSMKSLSLDNLSITNIDGTTSSQNTFLHRDSAGQYYLPSWVSDNVLRFSSDFSGQPTIVADNLSKPTGVYADLNRELLFVADFQTNLLHSFPLTSAGNDEEIQIKKSMFEIMPNPFNPDTTIKYELAKTAETNVKIFNIQGKLVYDFGDKKEGRGIHSLRWNGKNLHGKSVSSGNYLVKLIIDKEKYVKQVTLLK